MIRDGYAAFGTERSRRIRELHICNKFRRDIALRSLCFRQRTGKSKRSIFMPFVNSKGKILTQDELDLFLRITGDLFSSLLRSIKDSTDLSNSEEPFYNQILADFKELSENFPKAVKDAPRDGQKVSIHIFYNEALLDFYRKVLTTKNNFEAQSGRYLNQNRFDPFEHQFLSIFDRNTPEEPRNLGYGFSDTADGFTFTKRPLPGIENIDTYDPKTSDFGSLSRARQSMSNTYQEMQTAGGEYAREADSLFRDASDYSRRKAAEFSDKPLISVSDLYTLFTGLNNAARNDKEQGLLRPFECKINHMNTVSPIAIPNQLYRLLDSVVGHMNTVKQTEDPLLRRSRAVQLAAYCYQLSISEHAFFDGNGRTCRLLADTILQSFGLPPHTPNLALYTSARSIGEPFDFKLGTRFFLEGISVSDGLLKISAANPEKKQKLLRHYLREEHLKPERFAKMEPEAVYALLVRARDNRFSLLTACDDLIGANHFGSLNSDEYDAAVQAAETAKACLLAGPVHTGTAKAAISELKKAINSYNRHCAKNKRTDQTRLAREKAAGDIDRAIHSLEETAMDLRAAETPVIHSRIKELQRSITEGFSTANDRETEYAKYIITKLVENDLTSKNPLNTTDTLEKFLKMETSTISRIMEGDTLKLAIRRASEAPGFAGLTTEERLNAVSTQYITLKKNRTLLEQERLNTEEPVPEEELLPGEELDHIEGMLKVRGQVSELLGLLERGNTPSENDPDYRGFLDAIRHLNTVVKSYYEPKNDGTMQRLSRSSLETLIGTYNAANTAANTFLMAAGSGAFREIRKDIARQISTLITEDLQVLRNISLNAEEVRLLPEVLSDSHILKLDLGNQEVKENHGSLSYRLPINMLGPNGKQTRGFFTEDTNLEDFETLLDNSFNRLETECGPKYGPLLKKLYADNIDSFDDFRIQITNMKDFRLLVDVMYRKSQGLPILTEDEISHFETEIKKGAFWKKAYETGVDFRKITNDTSGTLLKKLYLTQSEQIESRSMTREDFEKEIKALFTNARYPKARRPVLTASESERFKKFMSEKDFWKTARNQAQERVWEAFNVYFINHDELGLKIGENINCRNVAMSKMAELLGVSNLICRTEKAEIKRGGRIIRGTMMEAANGLDIRSPGGKGNPLINMPPEKALNNHILKDLADLQMLDLICGNLDRNLANIIYTVNEKGEINSVKGIDNDTSFPNVTIPANKAPLKCNTPLGAALVISESMKNRLDQLSEDVIETRLRGAGLGADAIRSTIDRIKTVRRYIEAGQKKQKNGQGIQEFQLFSIRIISDKEWETLDYKKLLEATYNGKTYQADTLHNLFARIRDLGIEAKKNAEYLPKELPGPAKLPIGTDISARFDPAAYFTRDRAALLKEASDMRKMLEVVNPETVKSSDAFKDVLKAAKLLVNTYLELPLNPDKRALRTLVNCYNELQNNAELYLEKKAKEWLQTDVSSRRVAVVSAVAALAKQHVRIRLCGVAPDPALPKNAAKRLASYGEKQLEKALASHDETEIRKALAVLKLSEDWRARPNTDRFNRKKLEQEIDALANDRNFKRFARSYPAEAAQTDKKLRSPYEITARYQQFLHPQPDRPQLPVV